MSTTTLEQVQEYYGRVLQSKSDLQTTACCTIGSYAPYIQNIRKEIPTEVLNRFYGCGSPIPQALEATRVLDLGCGTGHDCFVVSKLVGEKGQVIGVDMTDEQISVAREHQEAVSRSFGFRESNVSFRQGFVEDLRTVDIADNSMDVVISNCVLNLSPDKDKVFSEIFRVLKPGGELYFSDVFADRRVPRHLFEDPEVLGECLGGALYVEDFRRLMYKLGCPDFRIVESSPIQVTNPEIKRKTAEIQFMSLTVRAFKLSSLEDRCEDFGQVATYKGGIEGSEDAFVLDDHHRFVKNKPMLVCGNSAAMVEETRFGRHFEVSGNRSQHFGLFDCGPSPISVSTQTGETSSGACC